MMLFIWIGIAIFFLCLELTNPGLLYFLSFSVAGLVAAGSAWCEHTHMQQIVIFIIFSLLFLACIHFFVKKWMQKKTPYQHYFLHYHLIGQQVVIGKQQDQAFYVYVDGIWWLVKPCKNETLSVGMTVRIMNLQGCHLQVEKV